MANRFQATQCSLSVAISSTPTCCASTLVDNFDVNGYFGVSVFAEVGGVDLNWIASHKLSGASWLVVFRAGEVLAAGLDLWDTGQSPHYDVVHEQLDELVDRLAACPHRVIPNPSSQPGGIG